MRDETIARNYADVLFELAQRHEGLEAFGEGIETVAALLDSDPEFRLFLETPRIADADKRAVVKKVFADVLPAQLVNFLLMTIDKRRQRLLREIAAQYRLLVDEHLGREHVEVTVARPFDDEALAVVAHRLSTLLGKEAIPHVHVDPRILGGIVVRTGDTMYDGSLRRRLEGLRRTLMTAPLPAGEQG